MEFFHRPMGTILLCLLLCLAAPVSAVTGTITLNVHPGGGTVCLGTVCKENPATVDGVGRVTFEGMTADSYYMVNVYGVEGYKPYLKQIYFDHLSAPLIRDISLEPVATAPSGTGSLEVFITPDGGKVCLDRMCEISHGDGTGSWNVRFTDITASTPHTLTISHEGYETYSKEVRILAGQSNSMSITLQPVLPGSTQEPAPAPVMTTSIPREPTRAALSGWVALVAAALCGWAVAKRTRVTRRS